MAYYLRWSDDSGNINSNNELLQISGITGNLSSIQYTLKEDIQAYTLNRYLFDIRRLVSSVNNGGDTGWFFQGTNGATFINRVSDTRINDTPVSESAFFTAKADDVCKFTVNRTPSGGAFSFGARFNEVEHLYGLAVSEIVIVDAAGTHTLNMSSSNGTGSILTSDSGDITARLLNFPTDDSQWVFYDDGQGGGDTIIPTLIPSGEVVGTPSVTNLLQLVEANAIPTQEVVQTPVIDTGAILISPATIPTGEVVYNVSVVDLTQFIEVEDISTQEVVGSPNLELLLSRIFPTAIATQENFETPLIIGGDRIAIPINDRATWNRVAAYLRTRKFSGSDNDVILAWLRSEGYIDTFNDAFNTYLEDVEALDGSLTDKYSNWRRQ